ncbi:MAG: class I SAM-dependent methyltransferase [Gemmatimonadales bacterium]
MMNRAESDWTDATSYDRYIGRWSRRIAEEFIDWLAPAPGARWLEVATGTGALAEVILRRTDPQTLVALDQSSGYIAAARKRLADPRVSCVEGDALNLQFDAGAFDIVASALALNHLPDPGLALDEITRVCTPGGTVAGYVWDYADGLELIKYLWHAAVDLDPSAAATDPARRHATCNPHGLQLLLEGHGVTNVSTTALQAATVFDDFDDYWEPLRAAQGSVTALFESLSEIEIEQLREGVRLCLPIRADGTIPLSAKAWAFRGQTLANRERRMP